MRVAAVELDDQHRLPPQHVRHPAPDPLVRLGDLDPLALAEQHELPLESVRAAGQGGEVGAEGSGDRCAPSTPPAERGVQPRQVQDVAKVSPRENEPQRVVAQSCGGEQQRIRERGDGQTAMDAALEAPRMADLEVEAGVDPAGGSEGDAMRAPAEQLHPPQLREPGERRALAGVEQPGGELPLRAQLIAAPRIHARVARMQEPAPQPALYEALRAPARDELAAGDGAELLRRLPGSPFCVDLSPRAGVRTRRNGHASDFGPAPRTQQPHFAPKPPRTSNATPPSPPRGPQPPAGQAAPPRREPPPRPPGREPRTPAGPPPPTPAYSPRLPAPRRARARRRSARRAPPAGPRGAGPPGRDRR